MKKKNIIKMILLHWGYTDITIETFRTGTDGGSHPNTLAYEVNAVAKNGDGLSITAPDFQETILNLFREVTETTINDDLIQFIDENVWRIELS
jgi:hypothetical protein